MALVDKNSLKTEPTVTEQGEKDITFKIVNLELDVYSTVSNAWYHFMPESMPNGRDMSGAIYHVDETGNIPFGSESLELGNQQIIDGLVQHYLSREEKDSFSRVNSARISDIENFDQRVSLVNGGKPRTTLHIEKLLNKGTLSIGYIVEK